MVDNSRWKAAVVFSNECVVLDLSYLAGLSKLSKLTWLSLAGNNLTTLDTGVLEKLPQLRYLSVENNAITYLRGLQVFGFFNLFLFLVFVMKTAP